MTIDGLALRTGPLARLDAAEARGGALAAFLISLSLVAIVTAGLVLLTRIVRLDHVSILYIIPVLIAATRWGTLHAITSALGGVVASAFFFYPPIHDLRVASPQQIADLGLFICVAIVTSHLADTVRSHARVVEKRELEVRALYAFSRRLAAASALGEILHAVRDHLSAVLGHRVFLFQTQGAKDELAAAQQFDALPEAARAAIAQADAAHDRESVFVDESTGSVWLMRTVSERHPALGLVAIDFGRRTADQLADLRRRVDAALVDAAATLERLDVSRAIAEATVRSTREGFREALIGSVSHELRTPLATILGAASVLSQTAALAGDDRSRQLVHAIRVEAERLNGDIRNLLDASRISSDGLRANLAWTDPVDLLNAAISWQRARNPELPICLQVSDELPLVHVDPVLVEQALRQVIDNAAKYSPPAAKVAVAAEEKQGHVEISVRDQGIGLTKEERNRIFERFYRGPRQPSAVAGSGLGLWIARAFVTGSGGRLSVESAGPGRGTLVTIALPAPPAAIPATQAVNDE